MKIDNVKVYDLEESIVASGLPMQAEYDENEFEKHVEELKYWFEHGIIEIMHCLEKSEKPDVIVGENGKKCYKCGSEYKTHLFKDGKYYCNRHYIQMRKYGKTFRSAEDVNKIYVDESGLFAHVLLTNKQGEFAGDCLIDIADIPFVVDYKWSNNTGYARAKDVGLMHKHLTGNKQTDHINRNRLDNRRCNFRECNTQKNIFNRGKLTGYENDVIGVNWSKHNKKWRAYITIDGKRQHLGCFVSKDDAIKCRLKAEIELFKEYAPQNELAMKYGIENPFLVSSGSNVPSITYAMKAIKRMCRLANCQPNSGHGTALSGILIGANVTASVKWWEQFQRYHFKQITSSASTMHRLRAMMQNGTIKFNKNTNEAVISKFMALLNDENVTDEQLVYSCPMGLELTARITTNYLALKTIWNQRHNHRLTEWRDFCKEIETLPYAAELILKK